jgi:C1A family cysteine protease
MYLRDACKIAKQFGDPSEDTVPGNTEQPKCTQYLKDILNDEIYKEAEKALILSYAKCDNTNAIKHALINYGPVLASVKWYDHYIFDGKVIQMDKTKDFGYHAITIVGYNNVGWICQNSWGRNFCGDGQFVYPYEEKLEEAWSFVDKPCNDVKKPRIMKWTNWIYKFVNYIINLFSK